MNILLQDDRQQLITAQNGTGQWSDLSSWGEAGGGTRFPPTAPAMPLPPAHGRERWACSAACWKRGFSGCFQKGCITFSFLCLFSDLRRNTRLRVLPEAEGEFSRLRLILFGGGGRMKKHQQPGVLLFILKFPAVTSEVFVPQKEGLHVLLRSNPH